MASSETTGAAFCDWQLNATSSKGRRNIRITVFFYTVKVDEKRNSGRFFTPVTVIA
jgi:hypothetical protein